MSANAKRMQAWKSRLVPGKQYPLDEALTMVKEFATAKFPESIDAAVNLGIDASKSDQQVRGSTLMPHGLGKSVRVAVFTGARTRMQRGRRAPTWSASRTWPRRSRPERSISTSSSRVPMRCEWWVSWARSWVRAA